MAVQAHIAALQFLWMIACIPESMLRYFLADARYKITCIARWSLTSQPLPESQLLNDPPAAPYSILTASVFLQTPDRKRYKVRHLNLARKALAFGRQVLS